MPWNELRGEELVGWRQLAAKLPEVGRNGRISESTIRNWMVKGIRGVRLESVMVGGRRFSSVEAVGRFFDRLSTHLDPDGERRVAPEATEKSVT